MFLVHSNVPCYVIVFTHYAVYIPLTCTVELDSSNCYPNSPWLIHFQVIPSFAFTVVVEFGRGCSNSVGEGEYVFLCIILH